MCQTTDVFIEVEFDEGERELRKFKVANRADGGGDLGSTSHTPIAKLRLPNTDDVAYVYCMNADTYVVINKDGDKVCAIPRSFFYALRRLPGPDEKDQTIRNVYTISVSAPQKEEFEIVALKTTLVMARATLVSGDLVRQVRKVINPKAHTIESLFSLLCNPETTKDGGFTVDHIRLEPENTVTYSSD